jgi:2-dehydro-3-deoxyglucarate aldolase/4-hydroxy-2-oxoheptanedioate aldolase
MGITANPLVVRLLANAGYDFVFIDCEHNHIDPRPLMEIVQMARVCGISPIVRPRNTTYELIAGMLDAGADGLIVPRVESREQAERLVSYAKFPPLGVRGCGTNANLDFQPPDWPKALPWLNDQMLLAPQVESPAAIEALDGILSVPGVDVALVGPLDLSISLGVPGQFNDPKFIAAVDRVIAICKKHNTTAGIVLTSPAAVKPWWEKGMRFFSCGTDSGFIMAGATANVQGVRAFAGA